MLSTKKQHVAPLAAVLARFVAEVLGMVSPVSPTRRRLPGGSFICPYTIATLEFDRFALSMTPDSIIS